MSGQGKGADLSRSFVFSCGTDKTVRIWDMENGQCVRKFRGHNDIVNSCHPARRGPTLVVSGGDDGKILVSRCTSFAQPVGERPPKQDACPHDQLTSQLPSHGRDLQRQRPGSAGGRSGQRSQGECGGRTLTRQQWDLRRGLLNTFAGHEDTVTGLALSPDGRHLLSNSMDCSARIWDVQPFAAGERCLRLLQGHQHNFEKNLLKCAWAPDGKRVSVGSSDRFTYVFDVGKGAIEYKLPGHQGSVNAVDFHPHEPIRELLLLLNPAPLQSCPAAATRRSTWASWRSRRRPGCSEKLSVVVLLILLLETEQDPHACRTESSMASTTCRMFWPVSAHTFRRPCADRCTLCLRAR